MPLRSAAGLLLIAGAVACAAPSAPLRLVPPVDRGQLVWDGLPPGEYLIVDATLFVSGDASSERDLPGEWRARFLDDGRARVQVGSAVIEGRVHTRARWTCTRAPLRYERGGLIVDVPRGGRLTLLGRSNRLARVGTPLSGLSWVSTLVEAETLSLDACAALPVPTGAQTVPPRPSDGAACVFGNPTPGAERALLPEGTAIEVGERRGEWAAVRAHLQRARVEGWTPVRALTPAPAEDERWVRTTRVLRVGALEVPVGTVGRVSPCRGDGECTERVSLALEREGRSLRLRRELARVEVEPIDAPAPAPPPRFAATACVYPDSPPSSSAATGGLQREDIRRVVTQHIDRVRRCFEARVDVRPELTGRWTASFIIGPTGRVDAVGTIGSIEDGYLSSCISRTVRRMRFPPPENGGVVGVNYPFVLSP